MASTGKRVARGAAVALAAFVVAASASALDFNDVRNLIRNQVSETVIMNMTAQESSLAITQAQADELRALGASEALIASIPRLATATAPAATTVAPQTTYVTPGTSCSGTTYYDPATGTYYQPSAPVVVTRQPTVIYETPTVVAAPTYVYPRYRYPRSSWNFSFHFGSGGRRHGRGPRRHGRW